MEDELLYSEEMKRQVWEKGVAVDGYPSDIVRKDACGALIVYEDFDKDDSLFGWRYDYIVPISLLQEKGVSDDQIKDLRNLRPLNIANIASKGDSYPLYTARYVAEGATNIEKPSSKVVNTIVQEELKQLYNL